RASARDRAQALLARLQGASPEVMGRLAQIQTVLRDDFIAKLDRLKENLAPRPVTVGELPVELKRKFIGADGRLLMQIYPAINTWEREGARVFVNELRTIDPRLPPSPLIRSQPTRLMSSPH